MGGNIFTHAAQIAGHYKGGATGAWGRSRGAGPPPGRTYKINSVSRIHRVTNGIAGLMTDHGIADHYRVAVMHFVLDMG